MHEMSFCDCGREIHWPRSAHYGERWRCYNCGRDWVLAPETTRRRAKPGYLVPSRQRRPPKPKVVVIVQPPRQLPAGRYENPFMEPGASMPALPAPRRRGGLLAWLFGE